MTNIEKALSDYLGEVCGMRLQPHALTGLAQAAIAAMQPAPQEPVAWMYEYNVQYKNKLECTKKLPPVISLSTERWSTDRVYKGWTETPLYAGPTPPQWQGIESALKTDVINALRLLRSKLSNPEEIDDLIGKLTGGSDAE